MFEVLDLGAGLDGRVERHAARDVNVRAHRHAELEVNLVVRGTATYLLGARRYELTAGTLSWLFPAQEHILVNRSTDHELYWAVFTPRLVGRLANAPHMLPLLADDPSGQYSRHVGAAAARRLRSLFEEVRDAQTRDSALANAGLAYLLTLAWRIYLDGGELVDGMDVHPAVRSVALRLRADPGAADLAELARGVGLSPAHLSRLFKAQIGSSLSRYRNQQRLHRFLVDVGDGTRTTMLAAALSAGFGSYAQFYRVFRQEMGRSPAEPAFDVTRRRSVGLPGV
jgi:AraC-like DNA-binding protein